MNLPQAPARYDAQNEAQTRRAIAAEDVRNQKKNADVDVGKAQLILTAANGTRWSVTVSNSGVLSATAV